MSMNNPHPAKRRRKRSRWPLTTLIEILPVIIALTVFASYTTIKKIGPVTLVTPLATVLGAVPLWVTILMALIALIGSAGIVWLIYIFTRAPVSTDGSGAEQ